MYKFLFPFVCLTIVALSGNALALTMQEQMELIRQQELKRKQQIQQNYVDTTPVPKPTPKPAPKPAPPKPAAVAKKAPVPGTLHQTAAQPVAQATENSVVETAAPKPVLSFSPGDADPELFPYGACSTAGAMAMWAAIAPNESASFNKIQSGHVFHATKKKARRQMFAEKELIAKYGDLTARGVPLMQQMIATQRAKHGECLASDQLDNAYRDWWAKADQVTKAIDAEREEKKEAEREANRGEVVLCGKALSQYTRDEIQKTLTQRGGKVAEKINGGLGETWKITGLLDGANAVYLAYTEGGQVAMLRYLFDENAPAAGILAEQLNAKYGPYMTGNSVPTANWTAKDGFEIVLTFNIINKKVLYLDYKNRKRYVQFEDAASAKLSAEVDAKKEIVREKALKSDSL